MISKKLAAAALALALGTSGTAHAAVVFKTLQLTASGFGGGAAIDPISILFTLNFDNSASFSNNTTGITQLANNAYGPLKFGYNTSGDQLTLVGGNAPDAGSGSCTNNAASFCSFISNISSATPTSNFLIQLASDNSISFASRVSIQNAAPVPEPAVWAMMLVGFGMVGAALRRRKAVVRTNVSYA